MVWVIRSVEAASRCGAANHGLDRLPPGELAHYNEAYSPQPRMSAAQHPRPPPSGHGEEKRLVIHDGVAPLAPRVQKKGPASNPRIRSSEEISPVTKSPSLYFGRRGGIHQGTGMGSDEFR